MDLPIQLQTTTADKASAVAIARHVVDNRLAACAQIGGPITSVYRWQGAVEVAEEWVCTIKTLPRLRRQVEDAIGQLHAYEEPEIIVTELSGGSTGYLQWLQQQVEPGDPLRDP